MSGLNFVKSNSSIESMLASNPTSSIPTNTDADISAKNTVTNKDSFKPSPMNLSMDIPIDETSGEKYNNSHSTKLITPPHPIASQHYYRKLFSEGSKSSSSREDASSQNPIHQSSSHLLPTYTAHPSSSSLVLAPPPLMYPANSYPIVMLPSQYASSSFSSTISDALFSLIKYIIMFLISIGIFKFGKRWFKAYFNNYFTKKKIFENPKLPTVSLPDNNENSILTDSKEGETVHNHQEYQHIARSKWQPPQKEPINDIGTILFFQRELNDLKLCMNELKSKISDVPSNSSFSATLLKQFEMQHEQQKLILSQNKNTDNSLNVMEMQREISNLRSDISQLKGMITMTPTILSSSVSSQQGLYQLSQYSETADTAQKHHPVIHNPTTTYQPKFLQQNLTSHSVSRNGSQAHSSEISSDNNIERSSSPLLNMSLNKSKDEPTTYISGINKRSSTNQPISVNTNGARTEDTIHDKQPSPALSSSSEKSIKEKNNQQHNITEKYEQAEPISNSSTNENIDYYAEYGEKIEPISEEEYNQVYDDYLSSLGKRFENQFNFHTGVDVEHKENSVTEVNNEEPKSSISLQDTAASNEEAMQGVENTKEQPLENLNSYNEQVDGGITPSAERKTISDFDASTAVSPLDTDVFNILKTPSLSFDELFVKAAPKTESTENFSDNQFNSIHMYEADSIISSGSNSVNQGSSMTPSLKEATKELRKTQLTAKQKKSKIFGMLLAPEKKKKKKKDAVPKEEAQLEKEKHQTSQEVVPSPTKAAAQTTPPPTESDVNNIEFVTLTEKQETISSQDMPNNQEMFTRFENYPFDSDERFQRMLSLTADDDECPVDKTNPNFLTIQKGIYFKQLLGNDEFDLEEYFKYKGIEVASSAAVNN
ncbi:hypothetical protein C9374_003670 [Naegleria lovaniensis]|uniref:PEX14-like helix-turn-helix domain-containing protein n=1 Tax=Naegleria lovaniensis TaxID=51637 RepID=A0AA88KS57_NAELO|nr:uncharacterized protein C9374_003670 [Naegleria lovaniensis]KAG2393906.1 hypothetical protein C9374_003670 [Naegleria lovaniensis]